MHWRHPPAGGSRRKCFSLPDVEAICEAGVEARRGFPFGDIADTIEALNRMGIEIADDLTQQQHDEETHCAIKAWVDQGNMVPCLTGAAWASLGRVSQRRKRGRAGALSRGGRRAASDPPQENLGSDAVRGPGAANSPRAKRRMVGQ